MRSLPTFVSSFVFQQRRNLYNQSICRASSSVYKKYSRMSSSLDVPSLPGSVAGSTPILAQAMLRITNPIASQKYYEKLGMSFVTRLDFEDLSFSLFFYAFTDDKPIDLNKSQPERAKWLWSRPYPTVELTWNWPKSTFEESLKAAEQGDKGDEVYVNGNEEPKGFGHLVFGTENEDGWSEDPDGYRVKLEKKGEKEGKGGLFSGVMLRVKDPRESIKFFAKLGMKVVGKEDDEDEKKSVIYMGYVDDMNETSIEKRRECLLRLEHEWGNELKEEALFTNGNVKPYRGFGHVGIIVDDIYLTMKEMEKEGYSVVRQPSAFRDVGEIAFIAEPSCGYWVEVIKREGKAPMKSYAKEIVGHVIG